MLPLPSSSADRRPGLARPTPSRRLAAAAARDESGFTLVEMVVAMVVLLVGVLGTATMALVAMHTGAESRSREGATNLGREIVESARSIPYGSLLSSSGPSALQGIDGLGDASPSAAGWQIRRRDVTYTVTVEACVYDDPGDLGFAGRSGPDWCAGPDGPTGDANGDDHRQLDVVVRWGSQQVSLTATVANPAGGFGPRITGLSSVPGVSGTTIDVGDGTTSVAFDVGTTPAATLRWDAGDAKHRGELAASGATSWQFSWSLGNPAARTPATCETAIDWVPDAPAYGLTLQPLDVNGLPGDLRTQTVALDRSLPYPVCDVAGGHSPQHGGVVELQWRRSFEGDVVSYSVWRMKQDDETADRLVCDAVRAATCTDTDPPGTVDAAAYSVVARQDNAVLGSAFGDPSPLVIPAVVTDNVPPTAPGGVVSVPSEQPTISWTASSDPDGSVLFYRIYRDGQAIGDRYGQTSNGATLTFTDRSAGDRVHSYSVSAVDGAFAESSIVVAS